MMTASTSNSTNATIGMVLLKFGCLQPRNFNYSLRQLFLDDMVRDPEKTCVALTYHTGVHLRPPQSHLPRMHQDLEVSSEHLRPHSMIRHSD